jgi:hypothetical protein
MPIAVVLVILFVIVSLGQNRPTPTSEQPAPESGGLSRDNFGPQRSRLPRLSRDALEKATREEFAAEEAREGQTERVPRATATTNPVLPAHRLSRDVMLHQPTAAHATHGGKEWQITLKNTFIEKYKNRVTLTTPYRVISYKTHSAAEDGDTHVAGLPEDVGLACVAEIMNYKSFLGALAAVKKAKSGEPVPITGAWRLWCEHPDAVPETAGPQIQDDVIPDFQTSNPNHVFEIHPLSRFAGISLEESFQSIPGYSPKAAKAAFQVYEGLPCRIVPDPAHQTTTLFTLKVGYNYVEFILQLEEDQQFVTVDGRIVRCSALSLEGDVIAENRRMVFVKDTPPETAVRGKAKGSQMHVLGIPRVDMALISYRTRVADTRPEVLNWNLPYEMIIVGLYSD